MKLNLPVYMKEILAFVFILFFGCISKEQIDKTKAMLASSKEVKQQLDSAVVRLADSIRGGLIQDSRYTIQRLQLVINHMQTQQLQQDSLIKYLERYNHITKAETN